MLKSANLFTKNTVNRYKNSDNFNSLLIYLIIKINSIFFLKWWTMLACWLANKLTDWLAVGKSSTWLTDRVIHSLGFPVSSYVVVIIISYELYFHSFALQSSFQFHYFKTNLCSLPNALRFSNEGHLKQFSANFYGIFSVRMWSLWRESIITTNTSSGTNRKKFRDYSTTC